MEGKRTSFAYLYRRCYCWIRNDCPTPTPVSIVFALGSVLSIGGSFVAGYIGRDKAYSLSAVIVVWMYCLSALLRAISLSSILTTRTLSVVAIGFQRTSSGSSAVLFNNQLLTSSQLWYFLKHCENC